MGEDPNASTGGSILPCRKCRNCHVLFHVSGIFQHERVCNTKRENGTLVSHALEHESSMICHETVRVENNTFHDKDQGNHLENGGTDDSAVGISENGGTDDSAVGIPWADDREDEEREDLQPTTQKQPIVRKPCRNSTNIAHSLLSSENEEESDEDQEEGPPADHDDGLQQTVDDNEDVQGKGSSSDDHVIDENSKDNPLEFPVYLEQNGLRFSEDDKALLRLAILLRNAGCPKFMFDAILAWIDSTNECCGSRFFNKKHPRRKGFMAKFEKRGFDFPKPKIVTVPMEVTTKKDIIVPDSEKSVDTVIFDFVHQLRRVLQDPEATSKDKTILCDDDPYRPYIPNKCLENIQDCHVFQRTVRKYRHDNDTFVVGLLSYMDKTHATGDGRFNAEPVVMVPSFLTMSEMRKPNRQII